MKGGIWPPTAMQFSRLEARVKALEEKHRAKEPPQVVGAGIKVSREVADHLLRCLWLYPNYPVSSRGPKGCILDALRSIAPGVASLLEEGEDPQEIRKKMGFVKEEG